MFKHRGLFAFFGLIFIWCFLFGATSSAAPGDWVDSKGNPTKLAQIKDKTNYSDRRFVFISIYEVKDVVTGTVYATPDSGGSSIWGTNSDDAFNGSNIVFYWPDGKVLGKAENGNCLGAYVVWIDDNETSDLTHWLAQPEKDLGDNCGKGTTKEDVTGARAGQAAPVGNSRLNALSFYDLGGEESKRVDPRLAGSSFSWVGVDSITTYGENVSLKKADKGFYDYIKGQTTKNYKVQLADLGGIDAVDFYYTDGCFRASGGTIDTWLAIARTDRSRGYIMNDDGDQSWHGNHLECLLGRNVSKNPQASVGGDQASIKVRLTHQELATGQGPVTPPPGTAVPTTPSSAHVDCNRGSLLQLNVEQIVDAAIGWFVCPFIDAAQAIVNKVGGWVVDQLQFKVDDYLLNDLNNSKAITKGGASYRAVMPVNNAWNAFRVISLALLIVIALVGLLLGSFIDAYTVKKVLPRILIAIIAISLSWDLMILALRVTNSLGAAVNNIINAPFASLPNAKIDPYIILSGAGAATGLTTSLGVLSLVGTAALAVLVAFIFTILRTAAIIAFVIFSPLAILFWILPGTQKGWKFWHEGLNGALLMYPIVVAFIAIGAAFGKILYYTDPNNGLYQSMALVATYAPYFLIPKAFAMAGGVVGNLSGMVNDKGRGAFDRLKKFRQGQGEKRRHDIGAGQFFKGGKADGFRKRFSGAARDASLLPKAGLGLDTSQWRDKLQTARDFHGMHGAEDLLKNNPAIAAALTDDDIGQTIAHVKDFGDKAALEAYLIDRAPTRFGGDANRATLDKAVSSIQTMARSADPESLRLAAFRKLTSSSTAWNNTYKRHMNSEGLMEDTLDENGDKIVESYDASGKMLQDINLVAGSNRILANQLLAEARENQVRAGRNDTGAGGFSDSSTQMDKLHRRDLVTYVDDDGVEKTRAYTKEEATIEISRSIRKGKGALAAMGEKRQNAEALVPVMIADTKVELKKGAVQGTRSLASLAATLDALGQTSPQNADLMSKQLFSQQVDLTDMDPTLAETLRTLMREGETTITYGRAIEGMRKDDDFNTMRREYNSAYQVPQGAPDAPPPPPPPPF